MPASAARDDPEMIESCLQAFESFVLRCPKEVGAFQSEVGAAALTYLAYDPNYADDDGEDMEEDDGDDDMEEDDDDDGGDYSDDDDVSWKVRRAAAKVLSALLLSRPDRLSTLLPMLTVSSQPRSLGDLGGSNLESSTCCFFLSSLACLAARTLLALSAPNHPQTSSHRVCQRRLPLPACAADPHRPLQGARGKRQDGRLRHVQRPPHSGGRLDHCR